MLLAFLSIKTCFITLPEAFLGNGESIISHADGTLNFARLSAVPYVAEVALGDIYVQKIR